MNILFIHGRAQEDFTQEELLSKWTEALRTSFDMAGLSYPEELKLALPYYGTTLIKQRDIYLKDLESGKYQMRSDEEANDLELLQTELLEDIRKNTDITEKQVSEAEQSVEQERGWKNWGATIMLAKLIDRFNEPFTNRKILKETDDVVTYLIVPHAKNIINKYYLDALTFEPTIVIAHSLGTVIAYDILHKLTNKGYDIRGLITLGSPLGLHAVIRQLDPAPTFPPLLRGKWVNIYDEKDIVSLRPLKAGYFRVNPEISNHAVRNVTDNRHGIEGYLSQALIAKAIIEMLG